MIRGRHRRGDGLFPRCSRCGRTVGAGESPLSCGHCERGDAEVRAATAVADGRVPVAEARGPEISALGVKWLGWLVGRGPYSPLSSSALAGAEVNALGELALLGLASRRELQTHSLFVVTEAGQLAFGLIAIRVPAEAP